ncbi:hypothetical protein AB6A23_05825 [Paenibacillus tarimensis]
MKLKLTLFIFLIGTLFWLSSVGANERAVTINVNGKVINSDSPPFIEGGTTYVPLSLLKK